MTQEEFISIWKQGDGGIICRTSGSTGTPKEIRLSKEMVIESARRTNHFFGIGSSSHLHVPLDFDYIAAKMMGVRAELAGARLTSENPSNHPLSDEEKFRKDDKIDLLAIVPSQMENILNNIEKLPIIGNIIIGGSRIPDALKHRIVRTGMNVWETYGMTETASHIALRKVGEEWFKTLPGITVRKNPEDCLIISIEGFGEFITNDLADIQDNRKFRISGRIDNVINTGGKKVNSEKLEQSLMEIWGIHELGVTSLPDEKWGERIVCLLPRNVVAEGEDSQINNEELSILKKEETEGTRSRSLNEMTKEYKEKAKAILPSYMVPKDIYFANELPKTRNNKIDRGELRKLAKKMSNKS